MWLVHLRHWIFHFNWFKFKKSHGYWTAQHSSRCSEFLEVRGCVLVTVVSGIACSHEKDSVSVYRIELNLEVLNAARNIALLLYVLNVILCTSNSYGKLEKNQWRVNFCLDANESSTLIEAKNKTKQIPTQPQKSKNKSNKNKCIFICDPPSWLVHSLWSPLSCLKGKFIWE